MGGQTRPWTPGPKIGHPGRGPPPVEPWLCRLTRPRSSELTSLPPLSVRETDQTAATRVDDGQRFCLLHAVAARFQALRSIR